MGCSQDVACTQCTLVRGSESEFCCLLDEGVLELDDTLRVGPVVGEEDGGGGGEV